MGSKDHQHLAMLFPDGGFRFGALIEDRPGRGSGRRTEGGGGAEAGRLWERV
jgi:hypothetical protein